MKSVEVHDKPHEENDAAQEKHQMSQEEHSTSLKECHTPYETLDEIDTCETTDGECESSCDLEKTLGDDMDGFVTPFEVGMHTNPTLSR